ncbi:MAG: hypothetical protein IPN94_04150 [Sphingobacteriales bacterium]|nr:hypothetical protein [Sphingobacteriales bacterium]
MFLLIFAAKEINRTQTTADVATSPYRDITTSQHHHIATSPHRNIIISQHRHIATLLFFKV